MYDAGVCWEGRSRSTSFFSFLFCTAGSSRCDVGEGQRGKKNDGEAVMVAVVVAVAED